jgi:hypothetical protein
MSEQVSEENILTSNGRNNKDLKQNSPRGAPRHGISSSIISDDDVFRIYSKERSEGKRGGGE